MKKSILYMITLLFAVSLSSCKEEIPYTNTANAGLNSFSVMFAEGEFKSDQAAIFTTLVNPTKEEVLIEVPWYWPLESYNETSITRMRVMANIDPNCYISPAIGGIRDLNDKHYFTFTNKNGVKTQHYFKGVIKKLSLKSILEFKLDSHDMDGVIDEKSLTVTFVTADKIVDATAVVTISPHASISPDPTIARSYEEPVQFTVTAHDGTQAVYTVKKGVPSKIPAGFREGSAKLMWAKKLNDDLGITTRDVTGGIAVTNEYVVINTRNEASVYIDRLTGEKMGTINLGEYVTGNLINFYNTADASGNILINNLITASGDFKIWRLNSVTGTPELYLTYTSPEPIGRKVSITGSLDGNAIIISAINSASSSKFARWTVTGGVLNPTPEIITISGHRWSNDHVDIVASSATNKRADYFVASYASGYVTVAWIGGSSNALRTRLPDMSINFLPNAIDYILFNNKPYILYNYVNGQPWGLADMICLAEVSDPSTFTAKYTAGNNPIVGDAIKWVQTGGVYGASAFGITNPHGTGDVAFKASDDGYYLYVYFMFTNGYVVCYRFDCIE